MSNNDTETRIIKEYNNYILDKSIFRDTIKVLPNPPQSFSTFPTIVISEISNVQNIRATSTNYYEHSDRIGYRVDIYTKNITIGNKKYQARNVRSELVLLTCDFFMNCGFIRSNGNKSDYVDISVDRYILTFSANKNNWNGNIR